MDGRGVDNVYTAFVQILRDNIRELRGGTDVMILHNGLAVGRDKGYASEEPNSGWISLERMLLLTALCPYVGCERYQNSLVTPSTSPRHRFKP